MSKWFVMVVALSCSVACGVDEEAKEAQRECNAFREDFCVRFMDCVYAGTTATQAQREKARDACYEQFDRKLSCDDVVALEDDSTECRADLFSLSCTEFFEGTPDSCDGLFLTER